MAESREPGSVDGWTPVGGGVPSPESLVGPDPRRGAARAGRHRGPSARRSLPQRVVTVLALALSMLAESIVLSGELRAARANEASVVCPDVVFIGVRGSGDSQDSHRGMGRQVEDVFNRLIENKDLGHVEGNGLKYPAIDVRTGFSRWTTDPLSSAYSSSVQIGASTLTTEIEKSAARCPSTPIVLGGHSQGAEVIDGTLEHNGPAFANVVGVVVFGDPTFMWDRPYNTGTFERRNGLFGEILDSVPDQAHWGKIASYCRKDDWICQAGSNPGIADVVDAVKGEHSKYIDGQTEEAAQFLADRVRSHRMQESPVVGAVSHPPGDAA